MYDFCLHEIIYVVINAQLYFRQLKRSPISIQKTELIALPNRMSVSSESNGVHNVPKQTSFQMNHALNPAVPSNTRESIAANTKHPPIEGPHTVPTTPRLKGISDESKNEIRHDKLKEHSTTIFMSPETTQDYFTTCSKHALPISIHVTEEKKSPLLDTHDCRTVASSQDLEANHREVKADNVQEKDLTVALPADVELINPVDFTEVSISDTTLKATDSNRCQNECDLNNEIMHANPKEPSLTNSKNDCSQEPCKGNTDCTINTCGYEHRLSELYDELKEIRTMLESKSTKSGSSVASGLREIPSAIVCCNSDAATVTSGSFSTPRTQDSTPSKRDIFYKKPNFKNNASFSPNSSYGRDDDSFFVEKPIRNYIRRKRSTILSLSKSKRWSMPEDAITTQALESVKYDEEETSR